MTNTVDLESAEVKVNRYEATIFKQLGEYELRILENLDYMFHHVESEISDEAYFTMDELHTLWHAWHHTANQLETVDAYRAEIAERRATDSE